MDYTFGVKLNFWDKRRELAKKLTIVWDSVDFLSSNALKTALSLNFFVLSFY
jgi:hypothetical protein